MSDLISYHLEDGIATLTLSNGKVNAISPDVITAFNAALDQAELDRAVVIITGQPGILSAGYDLKVMTASPEQAIELVRQGSTLARRLLAHPFPVIAACPGHAAVPAEPACHSGWCAESFRNRPSAMGLRQVLPVQMKRMCLRCVMSRGVLFWSDGG